MLMEEDQELRFVCKFCDKRYPSGKSLGGHMRSHVIAAAASNSAESEDRFEPIMKKFSSLNGNRNGNGTVNSNSNSNSNYGLRENPRKTWRAVDSTFPFPNEKVCKQCGKGFQSLKALCGHMACHSEKDKGLKDYDHSWTSENQNDDDDEEEEGEEKLVMDSHSDTEADDPTRITRSKTKRYKKIVVKKPSSFSLANTNNYSSNYNYGSSSVSEIDHEQEQEEVAMCLMMLSKDSGNWVGVNSVVESSDNNSVFLETKSSSIDMIIGRNEWNLHQNGDGRLEMKRGERKLKKSSVVDAESGQFENSNSGYRRNGMRKEESDISVHELFKNGGAKLEMYDKKYGKTELRKNLMREYGYGDSKNRIRDDSSPELGEESYKKRNKYECLNCNKTFSSFQGLGGHRPCHKKITNATISASKYETGKNSIEGRKGILPDSKLKKQNAVEKRIKSKKGKGHECPICFRIFKSGQALGGHKRSHFLNGSDQKFDHLPVMEKEVPEFSDLIDLNLPAPEED